jgi:short-subunit dehydrogenase
VVLPPFLPEAEPEPELAAIESVEQAATGNEKKVVGVDGTRANLLSPKLRKHLADLYDIAPRPRNVQSFVADWKQARVVRKREAAKIRRQTIFDELVALQAIKRNSRRFQKQRGSGTVKEGGPEELGYALVTGASQGIGRAIAVELARWDIPLILVARDVDKLTSLAFDLEACYGVKCCVLQADLSKVDAAEKIHRTTSDNGIVVDILANNAGVTNAGLSVDTAVSDLENMVNVNALTYAKLSCLYGQDMKNRKRGRILMVSSMAGLASAAPNTAIYGATKAFGKSLALSMAKELEQYGIGVTCLIPGPVTTEFRHSSPGMARALCWYLPFYPKSAESVAHLGVMSLLDGDTQVIPGWQNRVFVKIMRPILPQRLEALCTEAAFSPLRLPHLYPFRRRQQDGQNETKKTNDAFESARGERSTGPILRPRHNMLPLPRLLKLQTADPEDRNEDPNEMKVAEHEDEDNDHDDKAPKETANLQLDGVTTESEDTNEISTSYNPNSEKEEPGEQSIDTEKEKPPKEYSGKVVGKFSLPDDCEVQNEISPLLGPIDLMETEKTQLL